MEHWQNLSLADIEGEVWKDIAEYQNIYQVSNLGRVKSLERWVSNGVSIRKIDEKIRVCVLKENGYLYAILQKSQVKKMFFIHRLVLNSFIGESSLDVDHINGIKTDNRLENLEWVTHRENVRRWVVKVKDLPVGVTKRKNGYRASIRHKGVNYYLGEFKSVKEATDAYNKANNDLENIEKYIVVKKVKSIHGRGIYKDNDTFFARVNKNRKCHYLRGFKTPEEAQEARKKYLESLAV